MSGGVGLRELSGREEEEEEEEEEREGEEEEMEEEEVGPHPPRPHPPSSPASLSAARCRCEPSPGARWSPAQRGWSSAWPASPAGGGRAAGGRGRRGYVCSWIHSGLVDS